MTHFVTGGGGFLGSGLIRSLLSDGQQVVSYDDYSRGRPHRLEGLDVNAIEGDVRDADTLKRAAAGCDTFWHLAYINGTRFFYEKPDDVLDVGVRGTLNAIDAAIAAGARRFVFASTSETYQVPTHVPTREDERLIVPDVRNPRFSYGGGKITGELLTLHYAARRGLETIIFRPHNIYGPDMGFEHVIPEIVRKVLVASDGKKERNATIEIQGNGEETRSFCFIDDGADGARIAGTKGASGEIYHLGTLDEVTIMDLVLRIGAAMGVELTVVPGPLRQGGTNRRCPDIQKLCSLGYEPKTTLTKGLDKTVTWYASHYLQHGYLLNR